MSRQIWRPGNMLYPVPAALVTSHDGQGGRNVMTAAWTGTVCSDPAMVYVSVRPERYTWELIRRTGEYVIALTTRDMVRAVDLCGVVSGRDRDKFAASGLTAEKASVVGAPLIAESPVNLECRVVREEELGSHTMFTAEVVSVSVDEAYMDEHGRFCLEKAAPIAWSHGKYYALGEELGHFGFSVKKA